MSDTLDASQERDNLRGAGIERGSQDAGLTARAPRRRTATPRTPDVSESHPAPSLPLLEYTRPREAAATHTVLLAIMTTFMYFPWAGSGGEGGEEGSGGEGSGGERAVGYRSGREGSRDLPQLSRHRAEHSRRDGAGEVPFQQHLARARMGGDARRAGESRGGARRWQPPQQGWQCRQCVGAQTAAFSWKRMVVPSSRRWRPFMRTITAATMSFLDTLPPALADLTTARIMSPSRLTLFRTWPIHLISLAPELSATFSIVSRWIVMLLACGTAALAEPTSRCSVRKACIERAFFFLVM